MVVKFLGKNSFAACCDQGQIIVYTETVCKPARAGLKD